MKLSNYICLYFDHHKHDLYSGSINCYAKRDDVVVSLSCIIIDEIRIRYRHELDVVRLHAILFL